MSELTRTASSHSSRINPKTAHVRIFLLKNEYPLKKTVQVYNRLSLSRTYGCLSKFSSVILTLPPYKSRLNPRQTRNCIMSPIVAAAESNTTAWSPLGSSGLSCFQALPETSRQLMLRIHTPSAAILAPRVPGPPGACPTWRSSPQRK